MQSRMISIGVLVLSATALGGVYFWMNGEVESTDPNIASMYAQAQEQDFSQPSFVPIEVEEIAQRVPAQNERDGRRRSGDYASRMAQFDLDGDGRLSREERETMKKTMRDEMLKEFDLDGDGKLSREERQAARQARFEGTERGQALMRRFDANGDGVLSEEEQAAMDAYSEGQRQARQDEQIAQYDLDGDGELSREERQTQRDDREASRAEFMDAMTEEFDIDGDGELNEDEREDAFNAMRERREIDRFLARYDSDHDGSMSAADYNSFAIDYGNGDPGADVNNDGVVDTADLGAYRDLVTRSGNRP